MNEKVASALLALKPNPAFEIIPNFHAENDPIYKLFVLSIEGYLEKIIPREIRDKIKSAKGEEEIRSSFESLCGQIPIAHYDYTESAPYTITISFINYSKYTAGTGRYVPDMLCRWLIPGKILPIPASKIISFRFKLAPEKEFLFSQYFVNLANGNELKTVLKHIDTLLFELKLNILAVYYARYIVSLKTLTLDQKTTMIEEYISSLLDSPNKVQDANIHDQMQQFLIKLSAEERYQQVKENLHYLMNTRPKNFDRDVFYEIRHFMVLFRDKFTANRDPRHISRVIAFQYLFKKTILHEMKRAPQERHISIKILKTYISAKNEKKMVLGILVAMNFLRETEKFDKRHVLESVRTYVPNISYIKDSYILERMDEKMRTIYLEVEKKDGSNFSFSEIKELKNELPKEVQERVESSLHPIFMPRNEEEIIRNIIILSKQLKYVRDIPQVIINYEKQTDEKIIFTVICLHLAKTPKSLLKDHILKNSSLSVQHDETKIVGYLKRKYPKEANLFHFSLEKAPFFRKNFSLDLQKARERVVQELGHLIGDFRDFNGGMIVKQSEALTELRSMMEHLGKHGDFLLENFFYSLRPAVMQSVLSTKILKSLYLLLIEAIEQDFSKELYHVKFQIESKHLLVMISAPISDLREELTDHITKLGISSSNLTSSLMSVYEITLLGYIYRFDDIEDVSHFKKIIHDALSSWEGRFLSKS